jgi:hypothetical protein
VLRRPQIHLRSVPARDFFGRRCGMVMFERGFRGGERMGLRGVLLSILLVRRDGEISGGILRGS